MKHIVPAIAITLLVAGCGLFSRDIRLKREVAAKEVIGVWSLRTESLATAKKDSTQPYQEQAGRNHEIEFRADGTCHFGSISQMPTDYLDSKGMWQLSHDFKNKKIPQVDILIYKGGSYALALYFTEQEGKLVLLQPWGVPDKREFLKYEKKTDKTTPPAQ
jgi:hypothetical protein